MNYNNSDSPLTSPVNSDSIFSSGGNIVMAAELRKSGDLLDMTTKEKMAGVKLRYMFLHLLTVALGMF